LPERDGALQYQIKSQRDGHIRVGELLEADRFADHLSPYNYVPLGAGEFTEARGTIPVMLSAFHVGRTKKIAFRLGLISLRSHADPRPRHR